MVGVLRAARDGGLGLGDNGTLPSRGPTRTVFVSLDDGRSVAVATCAAKRRKTMRTESERASGVTSYTHV